MANPFQKIKVLLVDDTKTARSVLRQALHPLPYEFSYLEARDGLEAVDIFNRERPNLIFIDLEMPRKNGLQAVTDIRKLSPGVGIVVVSSIVSDTVKVFLASMNVTDIIQKPFTFGDLTRIMAKFTAVSAKKVSILIADDSKTMREVLTSLCKIPALDVCVTTADDGEKALIEFRTKPFDLVFLDVNMPKIDGLNVLRTMKRVNPDARVIMLTSDRTEATIRAAIAGGAAGYVAKPFNIPQIHACMEKLV
ncbi:MAG: response regulator [Rhodospirillaceae bacterium]